MTKKFQNYFCLTLSLLGLASGCLKPAKSNVQAQMGTLADSIQFTQLAVSGNSVSFQIARSDSKIAVGRATTVDPIDFPEYLTFEKNAAGFLTYVPSQSHIGLKITEAKCTDGNCTSIQMRLSRPGGTLADTAVILATRLPNVGCGITLTDANGAKHVYNPEFTNATVTVELVMDPSGLYQQTGHLGFYAQGTTTSPEGYGAKLFVRSFVGEPSGIWIDEIDSIPQTNGLPTYVKTRNRTYNMNQVSPPGTVPLTETIFDLYGSDASGNRVNSGCTSTTPITTTPNPPSSK